METIIKTNKCAINWVKSNYSFKVDNTKKYFQMLEKWNIDGFEYGLYYCDKIRGFIELKLKDGKVIKYTNLVLPSNDTKNRHAMVVEPKDLELMVTPQTKKRVFPTIDKNDPETFMYVGKLLFEESSEEEKQKLTLQILKQLSLDHKDIMEKAFDNKSLELLSKIPFTREINYYLQRSMLLRLKTEARRLKYSSPSKIKKVFAKTKTEEDFFDEYYKSKR